MFLIKADASAMGYTDIAILGTHAPCKCTKYSPLWRQDSNQQLAKRRFSFNDPKLFKLYCNILYQSNLNSYVVLNLLYYIHFFSLSVLVGKANAWLAANADVFVINCETVETRSDNEDVPVDTSASNSYDNGEQPMYYHRSLR